MRKHSVVVLVVTLMIGVTPLTVLADGKKSIHKELEAAYVKIVDALKKSDPTTFE